MTVPTPVPANVMRDERGHPLAVGINRFGTRVVVSHDAEAGLVLFMHWWRPWSDAACIPEDHVAFVGWVVP